MRKTVNQRRKQIAISASSPASFGPADIISSPEAQIDVLQTLVILTHFRLQASENALKRCVGKLEIAIAERDHFKKDAQTWRNLAANPIPSLN